MLRGITIKRIKLNNDVQKHIEQQGVKIIEGPVNRTGAIRSLYLRDDDLTLIEISEYI